MLGRTVSGCTALRWATVGRRGRRLPTVRGPKRVRCTTAAALRAWLFATADDTEQAAAAVAAPATARDDAADAILQGFGLQRREA